MQTESGQTGTETYRGIVSRVFFANPESPFMAGVLAVKRDDGTTRDVRFSGKLAAKAGETIEITGRWNTHPKYGKQFDAETGMVQIDESPEALVHLLSTHKMFRGLGPVRARKVVEAALFLSDDGEVASALQTYAAEIADRAGCPLDVVENAAKVWADQRVHFDTLAAICSKGWSSAQAQTIVSVLGENALTVLSESPYSLIKKIPRFGFRTVDAVALKAGMASTDPRRMLAGVAFSLDQIGSDGNTWTTRSGLLDAASRELRPDTLDGEDKILEALESLVLDGTVYVDVTPDGREMVADARLASIEISVFERLMDGLRDHVGPDAEVNRLSFAGPRAEAIVPTLNPGQLAAVRGSANSRYGVISGGAGVGKTYTMNAICEVAEENGLTVALCAPTGKAARKLSHATGREAQTIHRLLEPLFDPSTGAFSFKRCAGFPIEADFVVVDEVSMVDVRLMFSLLNAMPPGARLLMVGDHNQIPSVSPGAILRDLLSARSQFPGAVHVLTEIVRQAGDLARNTTAILDGIVVGTTSPVWGIQKTERGHEESSAALVAEVVEFVVTEPAFEPFDRQLSLDFDVQVLTPMKKGPLGTYSLNVHLQKLRQRLLGNPPPEPTKPNMRPKPLIGDRVIWTKNDYELNLNNGTQAIVVGIKKGGAMELFTEDGVEVTVPVEKRILVDVAYAMTIHKAQGSEWPFVVLVCSTAHAIMRDRNLLYTGASRASGSLTILGDMGGIRGFASTKRSESRQTFGAFLVQGWLPKTHESEHGPQPVAPLKDS